MTYCPTRSSGPFIRFFLLSTGRRASGLEIATRSRRSGTSTSRAVAMWPRPSLRRPSRPSLRTTHHRFMRCGSGRSSPASRVDFHAHLTHWGSHVVMEINTPVLVADRISDKLSPYVSNCLRAYWIEARGGARNAGCIGESDAEILHARRRSILLKVAFLTSQKTALTARN